MCVDEDYPGISADARIAAIRSPAGDHASPACACIRAPHLLEHRENKRGGSVRHDSGAEVCVWVVDAEAKNVCGQALTVSTARAASTRCSITAAGICTRAIDGQVAGRLEGAAWIVHAHDAAGRCILTRPFNDGTAPTLRMA
ncbi:hypothetical protein [Methylobacterium radiodurans]|uniref:hypothetical protein n=1 Tax=Methylobacterium radiodurans TaxID=2202828 RepID=UPI0013A5A3D4|nr:hypothetical protein [Methylobacterium radiodurans]